MQATLAPSRKNKKKENKPPKESKKGRVGVEDKGEIY